MTGSLSGRVVHLELHTRDRSSASAFYSRLLDWREERLDTAAGVYHALKLQPPRRRDRCCTWRMVWLSYVEVDCVNGATERARELGAGVLLAPREGPAGWRSVIATPAAGEIALWQRKGWRR
jgi:predicted enzyme related to lactoylglutathione lyase